MHSKLDSDYHDDISTVTAPLPSPPTLYLNPSLPKQRATTYAPTCQPTDMQCLTISANCSANGGSNGGSNGGHRGGYGQPVTCEGKSSPYSLWAEYFDTFPALTEFDLRSGPPNTGGNVVGSVSSSFNSSSPSSLSSSGEESWSSGSPFSDCENMHRTQVADSPFDDSSVIDEIVQTLKMDGYNFDHLGDDLIGMASSGCGQPIKQEQPAVEQVCGDHIVLPQMYYVQQPQQQQQQQQQQLVYTSLNRSSNKPQPLVAMDPQSRKQSNAAQYPTSTMNSHYLTTTTVLNTGYHQQHQSSIINAPATSEPLATGALQMVGQEDCCWDDDLCNNNHVSMSLSSIDTSEGLGMAPNCRTSIPLPPLKICAPSAPLQPIHHHHQPNSLSTEQQLVYQNHLACQQQPHQQQHNHMQGPISNSGDRIPIADQHQISYSLAVAEDCASPGAFSAVPVFPGAPAYTMDSKSPLSEVSLQFDYSPSSSGTNMSPPVSQPSPKQGANKTKHNENKVRRRRSTNCSGSKVEKPHVCKECGAAFKLSANLKQHQVIHTGEKPFSCEICKAMFTRLSSLKTHHRLHTGEKPHICPYCSAAFADRSAMKAHKRIHTGERPYKCQVCSTSFTQLSHLNAHKRTHTGEKPYACSVCNTTFKQLGHLKRHEKSHVCSRA